VNARVRSFISRTAKRHTGVSRVILKTIRKTGFDVIHGTQPNVALMQQYGIDLIFDVGANVGQYALQTRALGYTGRIVSFEPLALAYQKIATVADRDPNWCVRNFGLGDTDGDATIHVAKNSVFSSMLPALPSLCNFEKTSTFIGEEQITIHKLDTIFDEHYQPGDKVFLKIDVQGFEQNVLAGALESLKKISGILLELSFVPLYENETPFLEMVTYLAEMGFTLVVLQPLQGMLQAKKILQADGTFYRI
jgi:FkbM family methyltransferase